MDEKIQYILENFDFKKVHQTMKALNWTWFSKNTVPNIKELRKQAESLLDEIVNSKSTYLGTGGFVVRKNKENDLSLEFVVADWDSYEMN